MVALPNTKIDSTMIEEFSTPIFEEQNHKKYMYVSEDGQVIYKTITDIIDEINEDGGIIGINNKVVIRDWEPNYEYREMETVTYNNAIWKCIVYRSQKASFDPNDWKMLAGYSKYSEFFYDAENQITQIVLEEEVPSKGAFIINVNNLFLQSNNYSLGNDNKTITFVNPIPKDTQIEVVVYGNMIFPTNINNIEVKSFTALTDGETEFFLDESIARKEYVFVNVDNSDLLQSEWDFNAAHDAIILATPVNAGTKVQVQYFNNVTLAVGATFVPSVTKVNNAITISWTNDKGLPNPAPVTWYDGITFTPTSSKSGYISTISWSNDGGKPNPDTLYIYDGVIWTPSVTKVGTLATLSWTNNQGQQNPPDVEIYDGATFTPHVSKVNYTTTLSWTNDNLLPNPANVDIYDGVVWTPSQTKSGRVYTLSWTNDQGKQNPADVNLYDGVTFTPTVTTDPVAQTATISWTNDGSLPNPQDITLYLGNDNTTQRHVDTFVATANQTDFIATDYIIDKDILSVNIDNTELTSGAFSLGSDHHTVTIIDPVEQGAVVELKYFHNLVMVEGCTYVPHLARTDNYTTISWTNNGNLPNPSPVDIYDGTIFTPTVTEGPVETTISWTNNGDLPNPSPVSIFTNYAQRIVETFTATANQTVFIASHDIYNKDVLSVNVANSELTSSSYTLGSDNRTVTLLNGVSAGTLVDIKYFHNVMVGDIGPYYTPHITPIQTGYELSWTNNGENLPNPSPVNIWSAGYEPDILEHKFADHILNNIQWVRGDTFSWLNGTTYDLAYQHLLSDWNDSNSITQTETISGVTITYKLAPDGHKIVDENSETVVQNIFTQTGVAWYYIIDTTNQQFKLPRTQFMFTGYRDAVGNFVPEGLPNITGNYTSGSWITVDPKTGAFANITTRNNETGGSSGSDANFKRAYINFDASLSNSIYGSSTTVQPRATQMYLYFYMGSFSRSAIEQTAGLNAEDLNSKLSADSLRMVNELPTNLEIGKFYFTKA